MDCKIYPIVDEDVMGVPFPKAKMAKSIPALANPRTLDGLPAELLLEILSYISNSRSAFNDSTFRPDPMIWKKGRYVGNPANPNAELWSLCLTNRYLNYVSEPVLYQEFHHALWKSPALVHFLRAIIRRPHLASQVKKISLVYIKTFDTRRDRPSAPPTPLANKDDVQLFLQAVRKSYIMYKVDEKQIWRLEDSALVILLFSQVSNLRELHYNLSGKLLTQASTDLVNTTLWDMLVFDGRQLGGFPFGSLKKVTLSSINTNKENGYETSRFPLNRTAAWLFLPSVESLDLFSCKMHQFSPYSMFTSLSGQTYNQPRLHKRLPPRLSVASLTSITFRDSVVDMDALYDMLSHCKSLKSFDFQWGSPDFDTFDFDSLDFGSRQIDYGKVGRALQTQKHSLETLMLDATKAIDDYGPAMEKIKYRIDSLGSLQNFKKLSYVDVPGLAIMGWKISLGLDEVLPPNIQTLKIQSIGYNPLYQIEELARVAPESFRSLRLVEIGVWELKLADYLITNSVEFFAKRGVTLIVKSKSQDMKS